jgi:16S rRNA A1518/A1519 N6-dimethyltransferase RsmA/KsgA/DIM1 with predicted DNA glycosylase/AP lyase activity
VVSTILKTGGLEAQEFTRKALERCGIPENTRAEALDGETFAALAALLEGMKLHI